MIPFLASARTEFHTSLAACGVLGYVRTAKGRRATFADGSQPASAQISDRVLKELGLTSEIPRLDANTLGNRFEEACQDFLTRTFVEKLAHLRPAAWQVLRDRPISHYVQFEHVGAIAAMVKESPELKLLLGADYMIRPDVLVVRKTISDDEINRNESLVDTTVGTLTDLREESAKRSLLLHASVSCKWTMRSDRAQNARSEALTLIRNRKGQLPHVVLVTAEPTPSRLSSLALGTGDLDCIYHFALPELVRAVQDWVDTSAVPAKKRHYIDLLSTMIAGRRLKDIADLPLDLAV